MKRAYSIKDILEKRYETFPLEGAWADAFGRPERYGVWFVWGNSGNGKTSFVMQLCKELCRYDRVAYDSLEEGTGMTVQQSLVRYGMQEVNRRMLFLSEGIDALRERLARRKSVNIVVVDSLQYTGMNYREYIRLKEEFPQKLFIFISHASGKNPRGDTAISVMYDAGLKIWVEGYRAFSKGRFIGPTGTYDIWPEKAAEYWGG